MTFDRLLIKRFTTAQWLRGRQWAYALTAKPERLMRCGIVIYSSLAVLAPLLLKSWPAIGLVVGLSAILIAALTFESVMYEIGRARRQVAKNAWPQAFYYLVLAQQKLRRRPWLARLRIFRSRLAPKCLDLALEADLGMLRLKMNQPTEAERHLRKVTRLAPDAPVALHNLAVALWMQGSLREAQTHMRAAHAKGFSEPRRSTRWERYLGRHLKFMGRRRLKRALAFAELYQQLGCHEQALEVFRLSDQQDACRRQVHSLLALGRGEEACALARSSTSKDPTNHDSWIALGWIQALRGEVEEALFSLTIAASLNPSNLFCQETYLNLKISHCNSEELPGLMRNLEDDAVHPRLLVFARALVNQRLENWAEALVCSNVAILLGTRSAELWECIGHSLIKLGQHEGRVFLKRFLEIVEVQSTPLPRRKERLTAVRQAIGGLDGVTNS